MHMIVFLNACIPDAARLIPCNPQIMRGVSSNCRPTYAHAGGEVRHPHGVHVGQQPQPRGLSLALARLLFPRRLRQAAQVVRVRGCLRSTGRGMYSEGSH